MRSFFCTRCLLHINVTAVLLTDQYEYFSATKDDRIYIDMRRSKGNTDELEKLTRNDSGLVVYVKLKKQLSKS